MLLLLYHTSPLETKLRTILNNPRIMGLLLCLIYAAARFYLLANLK